MVAYYCTHCHLHEQSAAIATDISAEDFKGINESEFKIL
jgi:hypothetical protein